jgi:transposase
LDETSFLAATTAHSTMLVTGIIDLDQGRLIDVLPGRSAAAVTDWLAAKPAPWLAGIRHVVIDPYQPYATAVAKGLPAARVVVDHFHVIRLVRCHRRIGISQSSPATHPNHRDISRPPRSDRVSE